MGASAYIGRVGGLAVALGIGAAVATGQGVAWAGPTESDPSTTEPPPSADADAGLDPGEAPDALDATTPESSPAPEAPGEIKTPSLTALTSRANSLLSSLTRAAERGIVVSTGGALTSKKVTSQKNAGAAEVVEADEAEPEETEVVDAAKPEPVEKKSSAAPATKPVESLVRRLATAKPTIDVRSVDGPVAKVVAAAEPAETVVQKTVQTLATTTTVQDAVPVMMAAAEAPIEQPTAPAPVDQSGLGLRARRIGLRYSGGSHRDTDRHGAARLGHSP